MAGNQLAYHFFNWMAFDNKLFSYIFQHQDKEALIKLPDMI